MNGRKSSASSKTRNIANYVPFAPIPLAQKGLFTSLTSVLRGFRASNAAKLLLIVPSSNILQCDLGAWLKAFRASSEWRIRKSKHHYRSLFMMDVALKFLIAQLLYICSKMNSQYHYAAHLKLSIKTSVELSQRIIKTLICRTLGINTDPYKTSRSMNGN